MRTTLFVIAALSFVAAVVFLFRSRPGASKAPRLMSILAGLSIASGLFFGLFALVTASEY